MSTEIFDGVAEFFVDLLNKIMESGCPVVTLYTNDGLSPITGDIKEVNEYVVGVTIGQDEFHSIPIKSIVRIVEKIR